MNNRPHYIVNDLERPVLHDPLSNFLLQLFPLPTNALSGQIGNAGGINRTFNDEMVSMVEDPAFDLRPRNWRTQSNNVIGGQMMTIEEAYLDTGYIDLTRSYELNQ